MGTNKHCIAFSDNSCIASGELSQVASKAKALLDQEPHAQLLIFDSISSHPIEIDFRGTSSEVLERLPKPAVATQVASEASEASRGPGRPKLGVIGREVTLLPRHWDWLSSQPGGASVVLRKLVEEAKRANDDGDRLRLARESSYRFMSAVAGDRVGFEDAVRALFAGDQKRFDGLIAAWPEDIRDHLNNLASTTFSRLNVDH